jgi:hypothetical protein
VAAELENEDRFAVLKPPEAPTSCDQALPDALPSKCDYQATLRTYCASSGCHGTVKAAGLDLRVDSLLIARILEVPATHGSLMCSADVPCVAAERTCDECNACPENALLVDRQNPTQSWLLKKMERFIPGETLANVNIGCGDTMPSFLGPASARVFSDTDKACLIEFFTHVATSTPNPERFPCSIAVDGGAPDGGT